MNRFFLILKQRIIAVIFILLALCGGIFVYWYISGLKHGSDRDQYRELIYIAAENIDSGQEISEDIIIEQQIDSGIYDERYISEKGILLGKKAARDITKGEILSRSMVEDINTGITEKTNFSGYIPYGYRAVCIPVKFYGNSLLLKAGDRVDVISTFYNQEKGRVESRTILNAKEIVLLACDGEESQESGEQQNNVLFGAPVDEGKGIEGSGRLILLTFYLEPHEIEETFRALEEGLLNLAICPYTGNMVPGRSAG